VEVTSRLAAVGGLAWLHKWEVVCDSWEKLKTGEAWKLGDFAEGGLGKKFFSQVNKDLADSMAIAAARAASKALQEAVGVEKECLTRHMQDATKSLEEASRLEKSWQNVVQELKTFFTCVRKR